MLAKFTGWVLLGLIRLLTGAQARWWGCPPKAEQRIYFANHQSHLDLVMIWAALPEELRSITRPIAARDYWATTPFKRWITTEVFNAIYVERSGSAPAPVPAPAAPRERIEPVFEEAMPVVAPEPVDAMQGALLLASPPADAPPAPQPGSAEALLPLQPLIEALQSGDSIIIFPEGTRGNTGEPQKFKSGLYTLAQMFPEAVLVPAWIDNVQRVMPKGEVVPVPILCSVTFGEPVRLEESEERRPFLDRARESVIALRYV
ncbi:lysophospholipid acyltransferase family protein [Variovorax guangxiensis]|uniref:lysophospholipid acyltransferase family protein n=1 Tax=Variovorax guangxiensis TaxID=1775474 RepID=UPI002865AFD2|nr:lysophospholipid acyltransferase family protein [Variovorax guangxiensis]MDR6859365.1 1-acyl-sn-glycerol-3-phosphate acyltransferase [Variovorax guangxiensis]